MDYPLRILYCGVIPQRKVTRTKNFRPIYSGPLQELIEGPFNKAIREDFDNPGQAQNCGNESNKNLSNGSSQRASFGSIEDHDRYGRLNAFIPRDGVACIDTRSTSPISSSTLSQDSICYIQDCKYCDSEGATPSVRPSDSFPSTGRNVDSDSVSLSSQCLPGQRDGANHGTVPLLKSKRKSGRVTFRPSGKSILRSLFLSSATRRLSSLPPNEATPELAPLNHVGAASTPPTNKPGFFERLARFGRFRR